MNHPPPYLNDEGHLHEEGVARYVDALRSGDLSLLPPDVLSHVEDCFACKKAVTGVYALLLQDDSRLQGEHSAPLSRRNREAVVTSLIYRIAAILAALVGIGVIGYMVFTNYFSQPKSTAEIHQSVPSSDSLAMKDTTKGVHTDEFAEAFTPSEELDELVGNEVRSGSIEVASPKNGIDAGPKIPFVWTGSEKHGINLTILNNKGTVLKNVLVEGGSFVYQNVLPAGLYYWKLDDGTNLLHVGKFFVRKGGGEE